MRRARSGARACAGRHRRGEVSTSIFHTCEGPAEAARNALSRWESLCRPGASCPDHAMIDIPGLVDTYGYWAVFVGAFLEGETILALAGLAAYRGYLDFRWVVMVAMFAGF